jgi:hypothetical protein
LESSHQSASAASAENKKRSRWGDDALAANSLGAAGDVSMLHASTLAKVSAVANPNQGSEQSLNPDKRPRVSSVAAGIGESTFAAPLLAVDGSAPGGGDSEDKATKVLSARERYLQRKQQVQDGGQ